MPDLLKPRLDRIRTGFESKAPEEALTVMHRVTRELIDSGQADRATGEGQTAPAFELPGPGDAVVRSGDLLDRPLVLTFFRGHW